LFEHDFEFMQIQSSLNILIKPIELLGAAFLSRCLGIANILAVLSATGRLAIQPRLWTPPLRATFARQILFTCIDGIPASVRFAAIFGVLMIVQVAMWMEMIGLTTEVMAPMLWRMVVRELAPLLACMVVIGRSGVAIATELAAMRVGGEIEVLDSQGVDPMTYLVMPRILSLVLSTFCLAFVIASTIVATGYFVASVMNVIQVPWSDFLRDVSKNMTPADAVFFVSKTLIAGAFAGAICCLTGLPVLPR
jgi:phospholipid/cholesterol/gamma-HCH transport system permease protein